MRGYEYISDDHYLECYMMRNHDSEITMFKSESIVWLTVQFIQMAGSYIKRKLDPNN